MTDAAARVHRFARWRSGRRAARGARAGRADAPHRHPPARSRGRCGTSGPLRVVPARLGELGWTIGRNVRIDTRWATTDAAEIRRHAAELAALAPDVILAPAATTFATGDPHRADRVPGFVDPVGAGVVEEPGAAGRQRHRVHEFRIQHRWEMAGAAQGDRAGRDASGGSSVCRHTLRSRPVWHNPVRGAVAQGGGNSGQHGRRARARRRGQRGESMVRAPDTRPEPGSSARAPNGGLIVTASPLAQRHRDLIVTLAACGRQPSSISSSTSRPPRRWASMSRRLCSPAPTE